MAEQRKSNIRHFRDLDVYRRAFDAAMKIFELTKTFPSDERFSMVDQMRRASRSVCSNIAEGWRKRRYISVFRNKMTDAMQEASETNAGLNSPVPADISQMMYFKTWTPNMKAL